MEMCYVIEDSSDADEEEDGEDANATMLVCGYRIDMKNNTDGTYW